MTMTERRVTKKTTKNAGQKERPTEEGKRPASADEERPTKNGRKGSGLEQVQETPQTTISPDSAPLSERVNALVDKLIDLQRYQLVDFAYRVGEVVVQDLFAGDTKLLHQTGPKAKALSRLASHPRLPFSPATLSRSVGVYELLVRLPQFRNHKHLSLGHLYAVLSAPPAKQSMLLVTAIEKSWNVDRLLKEIAKAREKETGRKRGRPALVPGIRALSAVERIFKGETPLHDLSFVEELGREQVEHMKRIVDEMQDWCRQAAPLIERRLKVVDMAVPKDS